MVLEELGDPVSTVRVSQRVIEIWERSGDDARIVAGWMIRQGLAFSELGQFEKSAQAFESSFNRYEGRDSGSPESASSLVLLGLAYRQLGDLEKSQLTLNRGARVFVERVPDGDVEWRRDKIQSLLDDPEYEAEFLSLLSDFYEQGAANTR